MVVINHSFCQLTLPFSFPLTFMQPTCKSLLELCYNTSLNWIVNWMVMVLVVLDPWDRIMVETDVGAKCVSPNEEFPRLHTNSLLTTYSASATGTDDREATILDTLPLTITSLAHLHTNYLSHFFASSLANSYWWSEGDHSWHFVPL